MVPNFPAWICDMCGKREFDERAISWLTMLLEPQRGQANPPPQTDAPPGHRQTESSHPPA